MNERMNELFIHSFIHSCVHPLVRSFIHSFIRLESFHSFKTPMDLYLKHYRNCRNYWNSRESLLHNR